MNIVVLTLRSGGDFSFSDVEVLAFHLKANHRGNLRVICLCDTISQSFALKNCTLIPTMYKSWKGWWTKMNLFAPEMEVYRPFLYVDLDTAIVGDILPLFDRKEAEIIMLEDFYIKKSPASGVMWIPANSKQVSLIWDTWIGDSENYMRKYRGDQNFLSNFTSLNRRWQTLTDKICSFKVRKKDMSWLKEVPKNISVVCFHGHPRIKEALEINWVRQYAQCLSLGKPKVTVIIPYKIDRGWLQDAIDSVPNWVQLLISQGEGSWPQNFNKALPQATGDYIKFLHEDDLLTPNSLEVAVQSWEDQKVDFIYGNAINFYEDGRELLYEAPSHSANSRTAMITLEELIDCNCLHGGTLLFHRRLFDQLGGFDETLNHGEEYEFVLRCLSAGFKMGYCNEVLYRYRRHDRQKSNITKDEWTEANKMVTDKYRKLCQIC